MRTRERDALGVTTFRVAMPDVPAGTVVAQPGSLPVNVTRTAAGQYSLRFDTALTPLATGATTLTTALSRVTAASAGLINVILEQPVGTAANGACTVHCTALDKRT